MPDFGRTHPHDEMLFESRRGFVRCCRSCRQFELRFGNAILALTADDLLDLIETVAAYDSDDAHAGSTPNDHGVIWLGDSGAGFRFRRDEVAELHRLLAGARLFAQLNPTDHDRSPSLENPR